MFYQYAIAKTNAYNNRNHNHSHIALAASAKYLNNDVFQFARYHLMTLGSLICLASKEIITGEKETRVLAQEASSLSDFSSTAERITHQVLLG